MKGRQWTHPKTKSEVSDTDPRSVGLAKFLHACAKWVPVGSALVSEVHAALSNFAKKEPNSIMSKRHLCAALESYGCTSTHCSKDTRVQGFTLLEDAATGRDDQASAAKIRKLARPLARSFMACPLSTFSLKNVRAFYKARRAQAARPCKCKKCTFCLFHFCALDRKDDATSQNISECARLVETG